MSGILFAIDPGTEQSAVVRLDSPIVGHVWPNVKVLEWCRAAKGVKAHLVVEQIASYGMPVGREVFDTVLWSGRFIEAWEQAEQDATWSLLPRKDVKLALCGSPRAKDSNIRQALIDRYGGSSCVRKGGPLAGIKSHLWAALALAVTYQEKQRESERAGEEHHRRTGGASVPSDRGPRAAVTDQDLRDGAV